MGENESPRREFIAAFEKLYERNGMKGVSVAAIAKKTGYSRSSFYRSFESIYDVLSAVEIAATPYAEARFLLEHADTVTMEVFTDTILDAFKKRTRLICMLSKHADENHYFERMRACLKPVFRSQVERIYDLQESEYDVLAEYITVSKLTLLRYWAVNYERTLDLGKLTQITDSMFEGRFWERVQDAAKAAAEGVPYKRDKLDYFVERYPWIKNRPLLG